MVARHPPFGEGYPPGRPGEALISPHAVPITKQTENAVTHTEKPSHSRPDS